MRLSPQWVESSRSLKNGKQTALCDAHTMIDRYKTLLRVALLATAGAIFLSWFLQKDVRYIFPLLYALAMGTYLSGMRPSLRAPSEMLFVFVGLTLVAPLFGALVLLKRVMPI